jgi:hypothetical protein
MPDYDRHTNIVATSSSPQMPSLALYEKLFYPIMEVTYDYYL